MSTASINSTGAESMSSRKPLRKCINAHCKSCVHDPAAAGTWLAQVNLCPCTDCALYEVRPTTDSIPESVFQYYGVSKAEKARLRLRPTPEGVFPELTGLVESREEGVA